MSRSGENDKQILSRQRKKEIWPKQGKERTHRELGCLTDCFMFICQQFRIIALWWPTFTPLYQNCKESQRQKLISFNFCPEKWFPPSPSSDTTEVLAHRASSRSFIWKVYLWFQMQSFSWVKEIQASLSSQGKCFVQSCGIYHILSLAYFTYF